MWHIAEGQYRSRIQPASVIGSLASWTTRYQTPFILAGNPQGGAVVCLALFRTFVQQLAEVTAAVSSQIGTEPAEPSQNYTPTPKGI